MSEWIERPLSSLGRYINGFAFKPHHWGQEGLPIVRIEQLNNPDGRYDFCSTYVPADNVIDDGDLIFSWSATLKVAIWRHGKAALNQHLFKVMPYPDTEKEYLFQLLDYYMEALAGGAHGSTMRHIKRSELDRFIVLVPERGEQALLGRILRALDTQIDATEALIAKQERVRAGLMEDLFTRGVDEQGHLRPLRDQAPNLYHKTELGWLPLGWDVDRITRCVNSPSDATIGPFGSNLVATDYQTTGVPVIFVRDVKPDRFLWKSDVFVAPAKARSLAAHGSQPGDVVATKMGFPPCIACLHPKGFPAAIITADMIRLRVSRRDVAIPEYVAGALNSEAVLAQVRAITGGVTRPKITLADFRSLRIAYPPVVEQKRIFERLALIDGLIDCQLGVAAKLDLKKSGLMQDLLTGKVSVAPLFESAA